MRASISTIETCNGVIILKKVFVKNSIAVKKWFSEIEFYFVYLIRLV